MRGVPITCSFTGHRPSKLPWGEDEGDARCVALKERLTGAILSAYESGFTHYICGMAQGCDIYFAEAVLALRRQGLPLTLEAAIPYGQQAEGWSQEQQARYQAVLGQCDYETLIQDSYQPGCIQRRNRYLVDHCSLLIAAYSGVPGGTRQTLEYAMRRQVPYIDISI